jgi:hypothetical protein
MHNCTHARRTPMMYNTTSLSAALPPHQPRPPSRWAASCSWPLLWESMFALHTSTLHTQEMHMPLQHLHCLCARCPGTLQNPKQDPDCTVAKQNAHCPHLIVLRCFPAPPAAPALPLRCVLQLRQQAGEPSSLCCLLSCQVHVVWLVPHKALCLQFCTRILPACTGRDTDAQASKDTQPRDQFSSGWYRTSRLASIFTRTSLQGPQHSLNRIHNTPHTRKPPKPT